jgi:hypothetical protein
MVEEKCESCKNVNLRRMLDKPYCYSGDIPCLRCCYFIKVNDEYAFAQSHLDEGEVDFQEIKKVILLELLHPDTLDDLNNKETNLETLMNVLSRLITGTLQKEFEIRRKGVQE